MGDRVGGFRQGKRVGGGVSRPFEDDGVVGCLTSSGVARGNGPDARVEGGTQSPLQPNPELATATATATTRQPSQLPPPAAWVRAAGVRALPTSRAVPVLGAAPHPPRKPCLGGPVPSPPADPSHAPPAASCPGCGLPPGSFLHPTPTHPNPTHPNPQSAVCCGVPRPPPTPPHPTPPITPPGRGCVGSRRG